MFRGNINRTTPPKNSFEWSSQQKHYFLGHGESDNLPINYYVILSL